MNRVVVVATHSFLSDVRPGRQTTTKHYIEIENKTGLTAGLQLKGEIH